MHTLSINGFGKYTDFLYIHGAGRHIECDHDPIHLQGCCVSVSRRYCVGGGYHATVIQGAVLPEGDCRSAGQEGRPFEGFL